MPAFTGPLQMPQRAAQGFYLTLIRVALPLEMLEHFQDFVHLLESLSQVFHDLINLFDRFLDGFAPRRQAGLRRCRGWPLDPLDSLRIRASSRRG